MLWQAFVLSPGKEVFFEDPRFSLKTEYHAGFTLPHAAVLFEADFPKQCGGFFRFRPSAAASQNHFKNKEELYGIFCERD